MTKQNDDGEATIVGFKTKFTYAILIGLLTIVSTVAYKSGTINSRMESYLTIEEGNALYQCKGDYITRDDLEIFLSEREKRLAAIEDSIKDINEQIREIRRLLLNSNRR